ncbi:hypothetical protein Bbelb_283480 [Branchiostoma belcheri]|nr:hypothetical protein Bbelb_283480 [Branchiostoma belcheri]
MANLEEEMDHVWDYFATTVTQLVTQIHCPGSTPAAESSKATVIDESVERALQKMNLKQMTAHKKGQTQSTMPSVIGEAIRSYEDLGSHDLTLGSLDDSFEQLSGGNGSLEQGSARVGYFQHQTTRHGGLEQGSSGAGGYQLETTRPGDFQRQTMRHGGLEQGSSGAGGYQLETTRPGDFQRQTMRHGGLEQGSSGAGGYQMETTRPGDFQRQTTRQGGLEQGYASALTHHAVSRRCLKSSNYDGFQNPSWTPVENAGVPVPRNAGICRGGERCLTDAHAATTIAQPWCVQGRFVGQTLDTGGQHEGSSLPFGFDDHQSTKKLGAVIMQLYKKTLSGISWTCSPGRRAFVAALAGRVNKVLQRYSCFNKEATRESDGKYEELRMAMGFETRECNKAGEGKSRKGGCRKMQKETKSWKSSQVRNMGLGSNQGRGGVMARWKGCQLESAEEEEDSWYGNVTMPTPRTATQMRESLNVMIKDGQIPIREMIVPKDFEKMVFDQESGTIQVKRFTVEGRKHPLEEIRSRTLQEQAKFMRVHAHSRESDMSMKLSFEYPGIQILVSLLTTRAPKPPGRLNTVTPWTAEYCYPPGRLNTVTGVGTVSQYDDMSISINN